MHTWQTIRRWGNSLLKAILSFDPEYALGFIHRGNACLDRQEYDQAIAEYSEAIRLDSRNALAWNNRGNAWYAKHDFDHAIAEYNIAIQLDPTCVVYLYNRGSAWYAKQNFEEAIADYDEVLHLDQTYVLAYTARGSALYARLRYDEAIADFDTAIQLDPLNAVAYCGRGMAWHAKQGTSMALAGAIQVEGPSGPAISEHGAVRQALHGFDKAIDDYTEAIRLDPNLVDAYVNRGSAWHATHEYDKALKDFTEAIQRAPGNLWAYFSRALVWHDQHEYQLAIADLNSALQRNPNDIPALNTLAWLLASALDASVRDGQRAVELSRRALLLATGLDPDLRDLPDAELARQALAKDKNNVALMDTLALAHAEAGQFERAVAWQELALQYPVVGFEAEMRDRLELYRKQQPYREERRLGDRTQHLPRSTAISAQSASRKESKSS